MEKPLRITLRWVWCVLGVIVAGCAVSVPATSKPVTLFPTLLGYTQVPPTPTALLKLLKTPPFAATLTRPGFFASPQPLSLDTPICHETPVGSLWCLGLIHNLLSMPVEGVVIRIFLINEQGEVIAYMDAPMARLLLPPGESSPYGALFSESPVDLAGPSVQVMSAYTVRDADARFVSLTANVDDVINEHAASVRVTLRNTDARPMRSGILVLTLIDEQGTVVGFRKTPLEPLEVGKSTLLTVDVSPLLHTTYRVQSMADGWAVR